MGRNQGDNETSSRKDEETEGRYFSDSIEILFKEGLKFGLLYNEMYEMDFNELLETIEMRKEGLAYKIWRLASFTRHPFVKDFFESPEQACPELYPAKKGIPMPDYLKEKLIKKKRGGLL